ncbi:MAG TPA: DMT family protein [Terriglobales bacterium]|nr:DMT family protein [Terriglobales bacterium]
MKTVGLLIISNLFMTIAWYGHLKDKSRPLIVAILLSWGIAFFEYVFQVPANRIGYGRFTLTQLKIMQECITLVVFTAFAFVVFREPFRWNYMVSYTLIVGAVYFAFKF